MTIPVRFAPEAQADLDDAAVWYERWAAGVGLRLVAGVARAFLTVEAPR